MTKPKNTHGGKRAGSGRHAKPDKHITRSFSLHPDKSASLDAQKGQMPLGTFLVQKLGL